MGFSGEVVNKSFDFISYLDSGLKVLFGIFVFIWLLSIIGVYKDIVSRTNNFFLQLISLLLVTFLTPIIGLPIYWIIRPKILKYDKIPWRERLARQVYKCDKCGEFVLSEEKFCPFCGNMLKIKCPECENFYSKTFSYCPDCGAPNIKID